MPTLLNIALSALFAVSLASLTLIYEWLIRPRWHLRHIPGPPHESFLGGHMKTLDSTAPGVVLKAWKKAYGTIFVWQDFLQMPRINIMDKRALNHILIAEPMSFPKPPFVRRSLGLLLGEGVLLAEGNMHTRQRKIMNPSFGPAHMKSLYPVFVEKAKQLCDVLMEQTSGTDGTTDVDMFEYFSRTTLDVVASAGFGYEMNAIEQGNKNELASAFAVMLNLQSKPSLWHLLIVLFPFLGYFDRSERSQAASKSLKTMQRIGRQLLEEKKAAVLAEAANRDGKVAKESVVGKDLLSVLIKANMSADLKESQRLGDDEVMGQITTFLLAGNDTTASASSWALHALCENTSIQDRLRTELLAVPTDSPTVDELNALPYLDSVLRETLRLYSPVAATLRIAEKDSIIPLSEPYTDVRGRKKAELFIAKGTGILIPILNLNIDMDTWGPNAEQFNPERWLTESASLPEGAMELPSLSFLTFLAGSRACIGFRFTLLEVKVILFTLLRSLEFTIDPSIEIEGRPQIVTRPRLKSRPEDGYQLPLKMKAVRS